MRWRHAAYYAELHGCVASAEKHGRSHFVDRRNPHRQEVTLPLQHQVQVLCGSILLPWVYLAIALDMLRASGYRWAATGVSEQTLVGEERKERQQAEALGHFAVWHAKEMHRSKGPNLCPIRHIPGARYCSPRPRLLGTFEPHLRNCHCGMFHKRLLHGILPSRPLG